jgi:predicted nucleotide-binding protein
MVRRKYEKPEPQQPTILPEKAIPLIQAQIDKAKQLLAARPLNRDNHNQWELITRNFLEKAFGVNSPNVKSVIDIGKAGIFPMGDSEEWWENHRASSLNSQMQQMDGLLFLLKTEIQSSPDITIQQSSPTLTGHNVFLVHGHDDRFLHETARFLEKLQQNVIVLREQPNKGQTIIEKFEGYADVEFAVVLLTPDDRGGTATSSYEEQKLRARQNVILELGYFLGRLGRNRVCALYVQGVDIPSDYTGVLYVRLDDQNGWHFSLAKELKAAGLPVDMNLAL